LAFDLLLRHAAIAVRLSSSLFQCPQVVFEANEFLATRPFFLRLFYDSFMEHISQVICIASIAYDLLDSAQSEPDDNVPIAPVVSTLATVAVRVCRAEVNKASVFRRA